MCSADMYSINPSKDVYADYLLLIFLGENFNAFMVNQSMRVAMPKVNRNDVSNYWLSIPPKEEQVRIKDFIENQGGRIQRVIETQQIQIQKLKEYKATLINSAVTGKIKVVGEETTGQSNQQSNGA